GVAVRGDLQLELALGVRNVVHGGHFPHGAGASNSAAAVSEDFHEYPAAARVFAADAWSGAGPGIPDELLRGHGNYWAGVSEQCILSVLQRSDWMVGCISHRLGHIGERPVRKSAGSDGHQAGP